VIALLLVYSVLVLAAVLSGWLLWRERKAGAVLNLGLLPMEAVFWIGFALPVPWLFGIARLALVSMAGVTVNPADNSYGDHELRPEQRRR
jgi:hypothetical protein